MNNGTRLSPRGADSAQDGEINFQFKLLSAIGIVIIVAGHCYHGGISLGYEWFPNYSYNIALFVFISGYFYKRSHEDHVLKYIWSRTKRLLIPAYIWNIFYGLFILLTVNFGFTIAADNVNPFNMFVSPFIDGEAFKYNLGSWFVYPLFAVYVINIFFRKFLKLIHLDYEYLVLAVYLAIGIAGIQVSIILHENGPITGVLRLVLRTTFFLPCFEFGQFYKTKLEKHDNLNSIAYFAILFAVQLIILTNFENLEYKPSNCSGYKNGCVLPYVTAITGIAFWLRVSKLLAPAIKNRKFVRLIADNTYSIMIHQMVGYMSVKCMFWLVSSAFDIYTDFNAEMMKSSIWYYYLPNKLEQYGLLYLVGGIFVPILIALLLKELKKFILSHLPRTQALPKKQKSKT